MVQEVVKTEKVSLAGSRTQLKVSTILQPCLKFKDSV